MEKMKPTGGPGQSATGKERMARVNGADVWAWPRAQRLTGRVGLSARTSGRAEESGSGWAAGTGLGRGERCWAGGLGRVLGKGGKRVGLVFGVGLDLVFLFLWFSFPFFFKLTQTNLNSNQV